MSKIAHGLPKNGSCALTSMSVNLSFLLPKSLKDNFWHRRDLIIELTRRELSQRYRGSYLGMVWTVIIPLVMLLIYTFVFSLVFKARWQTGDAQTPPKEFALILFAGMTPFNVFSEVLNRSTSLIVGMPNYVKKVVFPLEVYPMVILIAAIITSLVNVLLILVGNLLIMHTLSKTIFLIPLAYLPLILLSLGLGWFLSSLGVYIRDLAQAIAILVQILFFVSPILYPASLVPSSFKFIFWINPLAAIVESFRQVLLWGGSLIWTSWAVWTAITAIVAVLGYTWFMATKKGFADVI
jgi:lipopolysaccharide transport system permease protein